MRRREFLTSMGVLIAVSGHAVLAGAPELGLVPIWEIHFPAIELAVGDSLNITFEEDGSIYRLEIPGTPEPKLEGMARAERRVVGLTLRQDKPTTLAQSVIGPIFSPLKFDARG